MRDLRESTNYKIVCNKKYCVYCGAIMQEDHTYEEYERLETTFCDCEGANLEVKSNELLSKMKQLKNNNKVLDKLRYEAELKELKRKYCIK